MKFEPNNYDDVDFVSAGEPSRPVVLTEPAGKGSPCCGEPSPADNEVPCCGGPTPPRSTKKPDTSLPFAAGAIEHRGRVIPRVSTSLAFADHLGSLKARLGVTRMDYSIPPGLYGVGNPTSQSPVLVTANYKLTFDHLRSKLAGRDTWILVLDTRGINVWCAAGKGTFGTEELLGKLKEYQVDKIVDHRKIILPQLGAPGVSGYRVKDESGFKVVFGPVEAIDLQTFFDNDQKVTPEMRRKRFPLWERIVLIPIELGAALKIIVPLCVMFFLLSGPFGAGEFADNLKTSGLFAVRALGGALVAGSILFPVLLPLLPGRSFSMKSLPLGILMSLAVIAWQGGFLTSAQAIMEAVAWAAAIVALTGYMALNFTGASTYTSLSGVKKEMRIAVPAQIATASLGLLLWVGSRVVSYFG